MLLLLSDTNNRWFEIAVGFDFHYDCTFDDWFDGSHFCVSKGYILGHTLFADVFDGYLLIKVGCSTWLLFDSQVTIHLVLYSDNP